LISTELKSKKNYFFFFAAFLTAFFAAFFGAFLAAFFLVAMCGSPPSGWVQIRNVEQNKLEKVLGNFWKCLRYLRGKNQRCRKGGSR
jgi:hypothetical protein